MIWLFDVFVSGFISAVWLFPDLSALEDLEALEKALLHPSDDDRGLQPIEEELDLAFENKAYGGMEFSGPQQDSGFDSSLEGYENVQPSYENVNVFNSRPNYNQDESYENVDITGAQPEYQNVDFVKLKKPPSAEDIYENYDFQEDTAVYQNMYARRGRLSAVKPPRRRGSNGRVQPVPPPPTLPQEDVYAKVKFLRQSIEEVNDMLRSPPTKEVTEAKPTDLNRPTKAKSSNLTKSTMVLKGVSTDVSNSTSFKAKSTDCLNRGPAERSQQFKALVSRFNSFSNSETPKPKEMNFSTMDGSATKQKIESSQEKRGMDKFLQAIKKDQVSKS